MLPSLATVSTPVVEVDVRLPVVLLHDRGRVGPTQAEVQGQVGTQLEVVLDVGRDPVLVVGPGLAVRAAALDGHLVQEEVRESGAREGAAVVEEAEEPVVAGIEALRVVAQELAAELQGVAAPEPGELLVELVDLGQAVLDRGPSADVREAVAQLEAAEAGDRLTAGDAEPPRSRSRCLPSRSARSGRRDGVVADEELVHQRRPEHVARVDGQVAEGGLAARGKNQGEGLLVGLGLQLGDGEAQEELVVGGGVPIEPQVALVGAGRAEGLADEVAGDAGDGAVGSGVVRGCSRSRAPSG